MKPLLPLALLLVAACTPVNPPKSPEAERKDSFRFVGGGNSTTARIVEPDLLWSSLGRVQTFDDGYRGVWRDEIVDIRTREHVVEGFIGSLRTELHITPYEDGYRIDGLYRGHLGQLYVTSRRIAGSVGQGWVDVARLDGGRFGGYTNTSAGALPRQRALSLPEQFTSLPEERQALYLALVIGG